MDVFQVHATFFATSGNLTQNCYNAANNMLRNLNNMTTRPCCIKRLKFLHMYCIFYITAILLILVPRNPPPLDLCTIPRAPKHLFSVWYIPQLNYIIMTIFGTIHSNTLTVHTPFRCINILLGTSKNWTKNHSYIGNNTLQNQSALPTRLRCVQLLTLFYLYSIFLDCSYFNNFCF